MICNQQVGGSNPLAGSIPYHPEASERALLLFLSDCNKRVDILILVTQYYPIVFKRVSSNTGQGNIQTVTRTVTRSEGVTVETVEIVTPNREIV